MRRLRGVARHGLRVAVAGALAATSAPAPAAVAAERLGTYTLQDENDVIAGTDRHYTQGLRLAWMSPGDDALAPPGTPRAVPAWAKWAMDRLPFFECRAADCAGGIATAFRRRIGLSVGHSIFTPEDTARVDLDRADRPYAGWLYAGVTLQTVTEGARGPARLDTMELDLGVVGPWAHGEQIQNNFHDLINSAESNGWRNQIGNEPAVALFFERKWRYDDLRAHVPTPGWLGWLGSVDLGLDLIPHVGAALGNVLTYAAAGATLRLGEGLPKDFGPPRIRPSLAGSENFESDSTVGWYVFAGVEGRAVARNIFLDGNTFRSSHSVPKHPLVGDFQAGFVVVVRGVRFAYTYVYRTREFVGQDTPDRFGAVSVSFRF